MIIVIMCKKCGRAKMFGKWLYPTASELLKLSNGIKKQEAGIMNMECPICKKEEKGAPL